MNRPAELSAKNFTNAPKQDLRTWLDQMEAAGEIQHVKGANRDEEIGAAGTAGALDEQVRRVGAVEG